MATSKNSATTRTVARDGWGLDMPNQRDQEPAMGRPIASEGGEQIHDGIKSIASGYTSTSACASQPSISFCASVWAMATRCRRAFSDSFE